MPTNGAGIRAEQLEMLAGMVHERLTSAKVGDLIAACESDKQVMSDPLAAAGVREFRREYDKKTKLPKSLVEEITKCSSQGLHAWRDARAKSDFSKFLPHLEKTIELARKKAECFGKPVGGELYDALMDEYEPGMTSARTAEVFKPLRAFTVELLDKVRSAPEQAVARRRRRRVPDREAKRLRRLRRQGHRLRLRLRPHRRLHPPLLRGCRPR